MALLLLLDHIFRGCNILDAITAPPGRGGMPREGWKNTLPKLKRSEKLELSVKTCLQKDASTRTAIFKMLAVRRS